MATSASIRSKRRKGVTQLDVARTLRDERLRVGLTQRELARRLGVGHATVAAIEMGRDPRASTLITYLRQFPGLQQAQVLPHALPGPPEASHAAWTALAAYFGFRAERVSSRVEVSARGRRLAVLEVGPVVPTSGSFSDLKLLAAVMRAVSLLPQGRSADVRPTPAALAAGKMRINEGSTTHDYEWSSNPPRSFTYRRTMRFEAAEEGSAAASVQGSGHEVTYPINELVLEADVEDVSRLESAELRAWVPGGMNEPEESDLASHLYPTGLKPRVQARSPHLHVRIDTPLVGVGYAMAWTLAKKQAPKGRGRRAAAPAPAVLSFERSTGRAPKAGEFATVVRGVRDREGLSLRDVGQRLGVSWVTVREAELGRNTRASTLSNYLLAFPDLKPQQLLPRPAAEEPMSRDVLWEYYRDVFGFYAEEVVKTIEIEPGGFSVTRIETRGLRSMRGSGAALNIRLGLQRIVLQDQPGLLRSIEADSQAVKLKVIERRHGHAVHQIAFPGDVVARGVNYTRTFARKRVYFMTAERAERELGGDPPFIEGTTLPVMRPIERLSIRVRFPRGHWPREFRGQAWPDVHVPDASAVDQLDCIEALGGRLELRADEGLAELSVERPPIGLKFALHWELP